MITAVGVVAEHASRPLSRRQEALEDQANQRRWRDRHSPPERAPRYYGMSRAGRAEQLTDMARRGRAWADGHVPPDLHLAPRHGRFLSKAERDAQLARPARPAPRSVPPRGRPSRATATATAAPGVPRLSQRGQAPMGPVSVGTPAVQANHANDTHQHFDTRDRPLACPGASSCWYARHGYTS